MPDDTTTTLRMALSYIEAGIYINPVYVTRKPDGKKDVRPVGLWRQTSALSADPWRPGARTAAAGIMIDCGKSGLIVVDCDGQEGIANWLALDPPPPLWIVKTPTGGEHWYYRAHPDHPIGNDQDGKVASKVDIRGLGGLVIAPPTTDGQGGSWTSAVDPVWDLDATVPAVVIERMKARPAPAAAAATPEGEPALFADPAREFTRKQALDFLRPARERLATARETGWNGAINEWAISCSHFPWLFDQEACGREMIHAVKHLTGWTAPDADDRRTIASAYGAGSWVAVEVEEGAAPSGGEGGSVPSTLPSPGQPVQVARALLAGREDIAWWRDEFYRWTGAHWEVWPDPEVRRWLYECTADATWMKPDGKGGFDAQPWAPNKSRIANLADALGVALVQRVGQEERCMALTNGVLDPAGRELAEHAPARFNLSSLPFGYDPAAGCPQWEAFLESSLPGDVQAHEFLGEWFGYVLSGRTDLQKIGALVGPTRCGKGTIARVLEAMLGPDGWCAPTLAKLGGGSFGTESMIGKSLAVMGDVRWTSKHVIDAVPALLGISGEDGQEIGRKYKTDWKGKLPTRIMLMSNDAPTFTDVSGALAGRIVYASFEVSFLGREDYGLEARLMQELPGILNWALNGLERLNRQGGRFTQSARAVALKEEVDRDSSPVAAWVDDWCVLDPRAELTLDALLRSYRDWLTAENLSFSPSLNRLSRELRAAFGDKGVTIERRSNGRGGKHRVCTGLRPIAGASIAGDLFDDTE